ncbi:MAG TPA: hypothetical protein VEZ47_08225 [Gemmatirosa sp.]|nr:hypothetical protein [Gemmatirosa sp.]
MLTSGSASNWVDRGAPAEPKLAQVLAHFLGCPDAAEAPPAWLVQAASDVLGMVAAGSSEVQLASYVRALAREQGRTSPEELRGARVVAVALWHVAKAAEVRDRAERVLHALVPEAPVQPPLGEWLAARLLSPAELAAFRRERE